MNKTISPPFTDRLDPARQKVLKQLENFSKQFVLAGGTALMLQIGHRLSYDFDCFSENELPKNLRRKAREVFGTQIIPQIQTEEQFTFKTYSGVEITFVYHPFSPLKKPISTHTISVFHTDDLATNKAYTIGRRGAWRDYVDLFILLKWKLLTFDRLVALAEKKFPGEFHDKLFLEQLVYFDDLEITPIEWIGTRYSTEEIKTFLVNQTEIYIQKKLK